MSEKLLQIARDAIADILDICEGWTSPMSESQKLESIQAVADKAWDESAG